MLQLSQFVWALRYSVWDVVNNFLLIDATARRRISSDQKRFFIALSLYPLSFFANTPFKEWNKNSFESTPCFVELKIKVLQHCREQKFCWLCPNCPKCPNSPKFPHLVTFSVSFPKTRDKSFTESFNKARIGFPKNMEIKKGIESLPQTPIF